MTSSDQGCLNKKVNKHSDKGFFAMSIAPQGMSIQTLYRYYRESQLVVNRRYQRKLVWSLDEKRALIDSILNGFPIPLFLLAEKDNEGRKYFEIIDGMQRLYTVFSFIENNFDYNGSFFDLNEFSRARQLSEQNVFKAAGPDNSKLDKKACANLLDYQLAVTIFPANSDEEITEVFNRINSYGRRLSPQEQRQVASISPFSEIVRKLASEIRGDSSKDSLFLHEMPEISIDSGTLNLGYGIKAEDCFWVYQGVLNTSQLRSSEDEQFIADIGISIVLNDPFAASKESLDEAYDPQSKIFDQIVTAISAYKPDKLEVEIKTVFSVLQDALLKKPKGFLRNLLRDGGSGNPVKTEFYALFMAFFELIVRKEMTPQNYEKIFSALADVSSKMKKGSHYIASADRKQNIGVVVGLIQDAFVKKDPALLGHGPGLYLDLVNSIKRSRVETARYEFKQGLVSLGEKRLLEDNAFEEIFKTIAAIANCGPDMENGFIFLGLADKKADADRVQSLDKILPISIDARYVVGIEREAKVLGKSLDQYVQLFASKLKGSQLSDPLKTQMLSRLDVVDCQGLQVMRISVPRQASESYYGNEIYFRDGNATKRADGKQASAISKIFMKK